MKRTNDWHEYAIKTLRNDPLLAAEYLNTAIEEGDREMFLVALRNVTEAYGGMAKLARLTNLNRPNLYKMLSKNGHPEIQSLHKVLDAFGLQLTVSVKNKNPSKLKRAA